MSTLQQIIDRAREEWLQDVESVEWTPARLLRHANDAHRYLARRMARVRNSRWFSLFEDFTISGGENSFDLASLSRDFSSIRSLYHIPSNGPPIKIEPVGEGEENWGVPWNQVRLPSDASPVYWLLQPDALTRTLRINGVAGSTRTFSILYVYRPQILTGGDLVLTPEEYDDLLSAILAQRAFLSEGEEDDGLLGFVTNRMADMLEDIATSDGEASGRRIRNTGGSYGLG